jgi:hypothetical protein
MANSLRVEYSIHEHTGRVVPGESGSSSRVGGGIFSISSSRSAAPSMNKNSKLGAQLLDVVVVEQLRGRDSPVLVQQVPHVSVVGIGPTER